MGLSFGCDSSLRLVITVDRLLRVAAHSRNIVVNAETLMGRLVKLLCSLEPIWLPLILGSSPHGS